MWKTVDQLCNDEGEEEEKTDFYYLIFVCLFGRFSLQNKYMDAKRFPFFFFSSFSLIKSPEECLL